MDSLNDSGFDLDSEDTIKLTPNTQKNGFPETIHQDSASLGQNTGHDLYLETQENLSLETMSMETLSQAQTATEDHHLPPENLSFQGPFRAQESIQLNGQSFIIEKQIGERTGESHVYLLKDPSGQYSVVTYSHH